MNSARAFEVYVHVPFCLRRCGYCDFNTYTAHDLGGGASRGNYANMAIAEMRQVHDWQHEQGIEEPPASSIFFGGGTPTVLGADDLVRMVDAIAGIWGVSDDVEITTEANPDTVDEAYITQLAQGGFSRISFGMQSAVPHVLRVLDRTHTPENVDKCVHAAQDAGLRVSVDLIYGAPGESIDDWERSVQTALDLGVQHISAYALTVEPTTKMGRQIAAGILPKPDDDDEATKYEIVDALCHERGLQWYEISNWAIPGQESRHNLGYWRNIDWAGIGPGAHSHITAPDGSELRAWDIAHPRLWGHTIEQHTVPWQGSEDIDAQAQLEERIMLALRLREGLDIAGLEHDTHTDLSELVTQLQQEGLVEQQGTRIIPTLQGRLLNDTIIERFFDILL